MATVTASSNLASRSSQLHHGPTISYESKAASMRLRSLKQTNTHNGLRILNPVDELRIRTPIKVNSAQARKKRLQSKNARPTGIIICGMNLIFVGTEVGPWSKTGGLGDVLGGLPPALAANGHCVMTIAPRCDQYKDAWDTSVVAEFEAVDPADVDALAKTVKRALAVHGTPAFTEIINNCMAQDLSWKGPAKEWEEVLLSLGVPGSEPGIDGEEIAPQAKENVATP